MAPAAQHRPLILLVEDSEDDAFFFRWTLQKCGLPTTVVHVQDGGAAMDSLKTGLPSGDGDERVWPDLVFLDLKLPTFSGFEVLGWIRSQPFLPPLNVAVLSGSDHREDVERAMALGASDYFVKPISLPRLRDRLLAWSQQRASAPAERAPNLRATAPDRRP